MPRVLQVVVTDNFAGTERYVVNLSRGLADLGWEATVVGGRSDRMREALGPDVRWLPGATPRAAWAAVGRAGRFDVCHAHMTYAEAVTLATRRSHRAPVAATRHFAARRGSSLPGRLAARWIDARLDAQIAISDFVAAGLERPPHAVLRTGVPGAPARWLEPSRTVLLLQRMEAEKQSSLALEAWALAGLAEHGWRLRFVGQGSERATLEQTVRSQRLEGVEFAGWTADVGAELAGAGLLLATAPAEPLGLSVVEAMAAGVPVVAAAGGGHLETVGRVEGAVLFPPGDAAAAARALQLLATSPTRRAALSVAGRALQQKEFGLEQHCAEVASVYAQVSAGAGWPVDLPKDVRR